VSASKLSLSLSRRRRSDIIWFSWLLIGAGGGSSSSSARCILAVPPLRSPLNRSMCILLRKEMPILIIRCPGAPGGRHGGLGASAALYARKAVVVLSHRRGHQRALWWWWCPGGDATVDVDGVGSTEDDEAEMTASMASAIAASLASGLGSGSSGGSTIGTISLLDLENCVLVIPFWPYFLQLYLSWYGVGVTSCLSERGAHARTD